jgi:predicted transcriptional regulator
MKFQAKLYKINKGKSSQHAYLAIIRRNFANKLKLKEGDGILVKLDEYKFPSAIKKHGSQRFMYSFTIPYKIGKKIKLKTDITFDLIYKNIGIRDGYKDNHINLLIVTPEKTINGNRIYIFEWSRDKLLFWIYSRGNKPFILPKFIPFEKKNYSLMELLGVFLCEGLKARKKGKNLDRLSFSNTETEQIKWFINAMSSLMEIKANEWKVQILYPKNDEKTKIGLKKHWSKIGFFPDNISIIKNNTVSAKYGVCIVNVNNSTLAEVFYHLIEYCRSIVLNSRENCIRVLRGFSRGDVGISSKTITFDSGNKKDVLLFRNVCKNLGIRTSKLTYFPFKKGWWNVVICGSDNFEKILSIDGIKHEKRKRKLIKLFLNNKNDILNRYLKAVNNGFNTSKEIAKVLNLSIITTRFYLSRLRNEKYLTGKVIDKNGKILHSLTQKGIDKLNFYQLLESELKGEIM